MNRELRRFYDERAKARVRKYSLSRWVPEHKVGVYAKTTARCSRGYCCGNPRRYRKEDTFQEIKQLDSFKDYCKGI